jgi:hypothetical protein
VPIQPKNGTPAGRYDIRVVTERIEARRVRLGIPVAVVAADVGLSRFAWYKKVAFRQTQFDLHEIGRIADRLGAPTGWPFLDHDVASAFDRFQGRKG